MICEHENFAANVEVNRLSAEEGGPIDSFTASVFIRCADCDEPMVFLGPMPCGDLPHEPAVNPDATELRLPIRPRSAPDDFGLNRPGFRMTGDFDPGRTN